MDLHQKVVSYIVSYLDKESGEITIILSRLSLEVVDRLSLPVKPPNNTFLSARSLSPSSS